MTALPLGKEEYTWFIPTMENLACLGGPLYGRIQQFVKHGHSIDQESPGSDPTIQQKKSIWGQNHWHLAIETSAALQLFCRAGNHLF